MFKILIFCAALSFCNTVFSDVVVIVNKKNNSAVSKGLVKKLYLGMAKKFDDGSPAKAINISDNQELKDSFNHEFLKKNQNQVTAYWARLAYSGRAYNLKESEIKDVISLVEQDVNAIAYIDRSMVTDQVRVVE